MSWSVTKALVSEWCVVFSLHLLPSVDKSVKRLRSGSSLLSVVPLAPRQITSRKLNGTNYMRRSMAVKLFFRGQGTEDHLTELSNNREWSREDAQLVSLLQNSMELEIAGMCINLETCKEIWNYARLLYSSNLPCNYDVSDVFLKLEQVEKSVIEHFAELKHLYEELNVIQPIFY